MFPDRFDLISQRILSIIDNILFNDFVGFFWRMQREYLQNSKITIIAIIHNINHTKIRNFEQSKDLVDQILLEVS